MKKFKHILVPTDFSDTAREALHAAVELVHTMQSRLSIVHVISDVWQQAWTAEAGLDLVAIERDWQEDAQRRLQALIAEEGLSAPDVTTAVLVGTPHVAIVHYASEHDVDLIVMGTHGHGPIQRFLLGSVAERLVRAARCPVLTVPHFSLHATDRAAGAQPSVGATTEATAPDRAR
jgi:nucleotide-binding universal stress UspA family protein